MRLFLRDWLPLLIWVVVMFIGSTDLLSADHTSRFIVPMLLWLKPDASPETVRAVAFAIRKCAHLCEYAILALLLWRALHGSLPRPMRMPTLFGAVLLGCAVFAASDEFHQSFTSSRTASVRDVFLDVVGAVLGLLVSASLTHVRRRKMRNSAGTSLADASL